MVDAIVTGILQKLGSVLFESGQQELKLVIGVDAEIKKLQSNFKAIHALLDDAEEKQIKDKSIELWLDNLKEVCYDIDDVLDEWSTALLKLKIDERDRNSPSVLECWGTALLKVCHLLFPCFSLGIELVHRRDIAQSIKGLNERLDHIANEKDRYQLTPRAREINEHIRREETVTFADVSRLLGRDEDKKELVDSLLCGSSSDQGEISSIDVKTISIVGMGGMGKTALAQLVYNDGDVEIHFDKRIWVCVPEVRNMKGVAKAVLDSLDPESNHNSAFLNLQNLLERIRKSVEGKKVFLVLDDVWTEEWESLKHVFTVAAPGSRILVTTRNVKVAEAMRSVHVFPLKELNDEACWEIIRQEVFVGRDEEQWKNLEETGRGIAKKCRGLPLAARTLGGLLRNKKTRREWEYVLNNEIWESVPEVYAPLLLSYYDLPSPIRRCFSYCSVIPKGHQIVREDLIREWMAQGFISSSKNLEMERIGDEYFECLVARSFFQEFSKDEDGTVYECKMHDVVVDFARFLMGDELVFGDLDTADDENSPSISTEEKTRHLSVILKGDSRVPPSRLNVVEKLRSITIDGDSFSELSEDLCNLCIQRKHLRSLDFRGACIINKFPKEVGQLMHLRLLRLNHNFTLKELPEAICELCNLQTLDVKMCFALERLPSKMEKLINLTHLDTRFCVSLKSYPKGIGRLTSLIVLRGVVVRCDGNDDEEFSLGDLENLSHLKSLFLMKMIGDEIDVNEAKRANLGGKKHLATLDLNPPSTMDGGEVIKVLNLSSSTDVSIMPTDDWVQFEASIKNMGIYVAVEFRKVKEMVEELKNRNPEEMLEQLILQSGNREEAIEKFTLLRVEGELILEMCEQANLAAENRTLGEMVEDGKLLMAVVRKLKEMLVKLMGNS